MQIDSTIQQLQQYYNCSNPYVKILLIINATSYNFKMLAPRVVTESNAWCIPDVLMFDNEHTQNGISVLYTVSKTKERTGYIGFFLY